MDASDEGDWISDEDDERTGEATGAAAIAIVDEGEGTFDDVDGAA